MANTDQETTVKTTNGSNENDGTNHKASNVSYKRFTYRDTIERRAMKQLLSNRRAEARYNESGTQQADRRLENRQANAQKLQKSR